MIKLKVGDKEIVVESNWNSDTHEGFTIGCLDKHNGYVVKSADKFLSKEQINTMEYLILGFVVDLLQRDD